MFKKILLVTCVLAAAVLAVSCSPAPAPAPAPEAEAVADAALRVSGLAEKAWPLEELKALPMSESDFTNKDGETTAYTGVRFSDLFAAAGIENYSSVTLAASDEYEIEIDQARLDACEACLIAIMEDGSLRSVMPGFEGMFQVRDLVALEVK